MDDKRPGKNKSKEPYVSQDTADYEGVRYTPSARRPESAPAPRAAERKPAPKKLPARKQNSQFAIFLISTVFVGVIVCVIVFAMVFRTIVGERNEENRTDLPTPPVENAQDIDNNPPAAAANKEIVAVITEIMSSSKTLTLFDLESNETFSVAADTSTVLTDKYGNTMVLAEFGKGEIVDAALNAEEQTLHAMQSSTRAWQLISTAKVDPEAKTIRISNTTYRYTDDIVALYDDRPFDLATLDPIDIVTVKGYEDVAWYVSLDKSHGVLQISEESDIMNGTIEIDTLIYETLGEAKELSLSEGEHRIVVKGDNIDPYTKEITVLAGETHILDLSEIELKAGKMTVTVNEPDAVLTINGEETSYQEPLTLDYGDYEIVVTKDGFADYSETVTFDQPTYDLNVVLEQIVQLSNISVETDPAGARIYIDNIYVGESPVETAVEYGLKTIRVTKDGYLEISFPVNVMSDRVPLSIVLQEQQAGGPTDIPSETVPPTTEFPEVLH